MIPDYYFLQDERIENVTEEGPVFSNCCEIHFTNKSSLDIYVDSRRVGTDETYSIDAKNPLVVLKKNYGITYKRVDASKQPLHPAVKLEIRRVYYRIIPVTLTPDAYIK